MSIYYDLYENPDPQQKDGRQPLHARVVPSGTLGAKQFIKSVSKNNGFSEATIDGCLQAVTDELLYWLKQGWIVEVGELGHFSLSLKCDRPVMNPKEIRSPSIRLNKINLRVGRHFRQRMEPLQLERTTSPNRSSGNADADRCRTLLLKHLEKQGVINRADFMKLTGVNRLKAIDLLNGYIKEGIIRRYGGGKAVVYLKKEG